MSNYLNYELLKFTHASSPGDDLLHIEDGQNFAISSCVFAPTGKPDTYDECLGIVNAGVGVVERTLFVGAGKTCLINSAQSVHFQDCVFKDCSRRFPIGNGHIIMERCVFINWGVPESFYVKSGAVRARYGGTIIELKDCVFLQESFGRCLTRGNAWQDFIYNLTWPYYGPGFMRAAIAEDKAKITATNCYTNRPWLVLHGRQGSMSKERAEQIMADVFATLPKEENLTLYGT